MSLWSLSQFCCVNWITCYSVMEVVFVSLVLLSAPSLAKTEMIFFITDPSLGFFVIPHLAVHCAAL